MASIDQRPARLDMYCAVSDDFSAAFTVTENGSPWVSTGATITSAILNQAGTVQATNFTTSASTGSLTLSLTDTQTTTLGAGQYRYWVAVTKSSLTRTWIAGTFTVAAASGTGTSSTSATLSVTTDTITLDLSTLVNPSALYPSVRSTTKVLIVGSSNAAGQGASTYASSWAGLLATNLASTHTFINSAVSGRSPSVWITPDVTTGRSPLEDLLVAHRPHVVILAFTGQNLAEGPSQTLIDCATKAGRLCEDYGARPVYITPYISNGYTSTQRDANAWCGEQMKRRNLPLLDFATVYGPGPTIPAAVDSGDGLHLNDTGHLEQYRQIPTDYLSITNNISPIIMPSINAGLTVPAAAVVAPAKTTTFPAGSFTVSFWLNIPNSPTIALVAASWAGTTSNTRIRIPFLGTGSTVRVDLAATGTIITGVDVTYNAEHHIALTYNAVSRLFTLYIDGASVGTGTGDSGVTFTGFNIGCRTDLAAQTVGYRFRNVTIHATELAARDIANLYVGRVPLNALYLAAPLQDAVGRPASAPLTNLHGTVALTSGPVLP